MVDHKDQTAQTQVVAEEQPTDPDRDELTDSELKKVVGGDTPMYDPEPEPIPIQTWQ